MNFKTKFLLIVGCLLLAIPLITSAKKKASDTVVVDCAKGDSIMAALANTAEVLTIEIIGMCEEEVQIRRDNVTLWGTDPTVDGIQPVPDQPLNQALDLFGVHQVTIGNLKLTGGNVGLGMNNSFAIEINNCRIEDNDSVGLIIGSASGSINLVNTLVSGNGHTGVLVANGSGLNCRGCTVNSHRLREFQLGGGSGLGLFDATIQGTRAIEATGGARVFNLFLSPPNTLEGSTAAIRLIGNASVDLGNDAIVGVLDLQQKSVATFNNITQTVSSGVNNIQSGSSLVVRGSTSLAGNFSISEFSDLTMHGGTTVTGNLSCSRGADAFCDNPAASVAGTTNCGQCKKLP